MNEPQYRALRRVATEGGGVDYDGLRVWHDERGYGFVTPEVERTGLSADEFRESATERPWYVSNWYYWNCEVASDARDPDAASGESRSAPPRRTCRPAFLRWLERAPDLSVPERYEALAEGVVREWGELRLTARLGDDGTRLYEVRHADDADESVERLTVHADTEAVRSIVTEDACGRYRPLKSAPTLRSGWVFPDLRGRDLLDVVDAFYPASVVNWHLERHGELDVTHWSDTAARQTGIYDVVDQLSTGAVERVAESCCVDSQCLKRREWDLDETTELVADRGGGEFPCREPCSLVVAAAREWAGLEREQPRTYEFELTPSEKEQLERLVHAVADGEIADVREADLSDGANRYRVRYLRAKRFDEDGTLDWLRTEPGEGSEE